MTKVLLVDDEPLMLVGLESMLEWKDYDIKICGTARNGGQALELIEEKRPDIVITDIKMPVKNGLELVQSCREIYGRIPLFILLTAVEEYQYVKQAIHYQAVDYLVKLELTEEMLVTSLTKAKEILATFNKLTKYSGFAKNHVVQQVKEYIGQNLDKKLDLTHVAAIFGYSPKYISLLFAKHAESSFVEYINAEKIERAKELLLTGNIKAYEISDKLGFESSFYFSKVFKKYTGLSPREFVKNQGDALI